MWTGSAGGVYDDKQPDDVTDSMATDWFPAGGDGVKHAGGDQQFVQLRSVLVSVDQVPTHVRPAVLFALLRRRDRQMQRRLDCSGHRSTFSDPQRNAERVSTGPVPTNSRDLGQALTEREKDVVKTITDEKKLLSALEKREFSLQ